MRQISNLVALVVGKAVAKSLMLVDRSSGKRVTLHDMLLVEYPPDLIKSDGRLIFDGLGEC